MKSARSQPHRHLAIQYRCRSINQRLLNSVQAKSSRRRTAESDCTNWTLWIRVPSSNFRLTARLIAAL